MTRFTTVLVLLALLCAADSGARRQRARAHQNPNGPKFEFLDSNVHDFGMIGNLKPATHIFRFRNGGSMPLTIENAEPSCGCTVPVFSKVPLQPGDTSSITVTFDPTGRGGPFEKSVYLRSNAIGAPNELYIKGVVILTGDAGQ